MYWWYQSSFQYAKSQMDPSADEKCKKLYGPLQLPKVQNRGKIGKNQSYQVESRTIENSQKDHDDFSNPGKTYWRTQTNT